MISISIVKTGETLKKLSVNGHSMSGDYGENIVCAAISVLTIAFVNGLTEVCRIKDISVVSGDGFVEVTLGNLTDHENDKVTLLFKTLVLAYKQLQQEYPEEIKLEVK